jgi:Fic family protein
MRSIEKAPGLNFKGIDEIILRLVQDSSFAALVNDVNENYYYWDKIKYLPMPENIIPEDVWTIAKIRRISTAFRVQFGNYKFTWFLNGRIQQLLHVFDLNIGGTLESRSLIPKDEKNRYLVSSIMEEAIASSQIEGAVTTRKQAKEMLRKNKPPKNKSEQMIVNNYSTIQKILELKNDDLSREKLLEIHKLVSNNTMPDKEDEGTFRKTNDVNVIDVIDGEILYRPPVVDDIEKLIEDLCIFFNQEKDKPFIHPIIKGCIIHFMLGFIHPFADGNGRTARALFYWYLLRKGYWLTEYLSISKLILRSKGQYAKAFIYTETDDNDLTYFINYKLKTMNLAYKSLREYIQRKIEEKRHLSEFIKIEGINERQALILKWYYEESALILTVKEIETRMAISNQTARSDLQELAEYGFLQSININLKTQAFTRSYNFEDLLKQRLNQSVQKMIF